MSIIQQLLSKLSPDWSLEPGRTNSIRASFNKGYIAVSLYDMRTDDKVAGKYNFVAILFSTKLTSQMSMSVLSTQTGSEQHYDFLIDKKRRCRVQSRRGG
jgi:hypothetical protein